MPPVRGNGYETDAKWQRDRCVQKGNRQTDEEARNCAAQHAARPTSRRVPRARSSRRRRRSAMSPLARRCAQIPRDRIQT